MTASSAKEPLQNSWRCVFVIVIISFTGTGLIASSLVGLNPLTPAIKKTYSNIFEDRYGVPMTKGDWTMLLALTMSILYAGGFFGSLLTNSFLRRFTRKRVLLLVYLINSIGIIFMAVGTTVGQSYEMVICGRFIAGVSLGIGLATFPLVINEYSVPHKRLFYGALYGAFFAVMGLISTVISWPKVLGSYETYLGALLCGLLYPITYFLCMRWIPETPYQAVLKDDKTMELNILKELRTGNKAALAEMEIMAAHLHNGGVISKIREASWKDILNTPQFRKHFIAVVIVFSSMTAIGVTNVMSFSDKIFRESGLPKDAITPASMGIYCVSTIFSFIGVLAMRKVDPRTLIISCGIVLSLSHALMTASIETFHWAPSMSWASMAALWMFMACFSVIKTLVFGIMGILCINETRSKCLVVGAAAFWILGWLVGFISPYLTVRSLAININFIFLSLRYKQVWIRGYSFLVWMTITLLEVIYMFYGVPKTRNRSEDEIQTFFKNVTKQTTPGV